MLPISYYFSLSFALFFIGVIGALLRRSPTIVAVSIGLMVTASSINWVAFSRFFGDPAGQDFALLLMIAALAEAVVLVSLVAPRLQEQAADPIGQSTAEPALVPTPAATDRAE